MSETSNTSRISTDEVKPGERASWWSDAVCARLVEVQCDPLGDAKSFFGDIRHHNLRSLSVSRIHSCAQRVQRTPAWLAQASEEHFLLNIQCAGQSVVRQGGREALLQVGDMALYSSASRYELAFDADFEQTVVIFPAQPFRSLAPGVERLMATRLDHELATEVRQLSRLLLVPPAGSDNAILCMAGEGLLYKLAALVNAQCHAQGGKQVGLPQPDAVDNTVRDGVAQLALDALDCALIMLDANAKVLLCNQRARSVMAMNEGLHMEHGQLVLSRKFGVCLPTALRRVQSSGLAQSLALREAKGKILHLVTIVRRGSGLMLMLSTPGGQRQNSVKQWRELFSLTPSEAVLAAALAGGKSLDEHAQEHGIKPSTARTQLKAVLQKTGTHRQQNLVLLLAGLPSVR